MTKSSKRSKESRKPGAGKTPSGKGGGVGPPPLPQLSHLQFLVLGILLGTERRGFEIREELAHFGVRKSGPAFYQLMARLEDSELISGRYHQEIIEGQIIRERIYKIRARGERAWAECRDFQLSVIDRLGGRAGGTHV
ncbi:MAG: hypothetical protein ACYTGC_15345 [Planctomycetota bacterium]|jgi:DNA-binding PadR family transcriptional regulator